MRIGRLSAMVILYTVLFCLMMVLFGYLIGSIPTSIIIGKMHGIDIRQFGKTCYRLVHNSDKY